MRKKWLWIVAAAVIGGACACSGGGPGKESSAAAKEETTAQEEPEETTEDATCETQTAEGKVEEPESGNGETDNPLKASVISEDQEEEGGEYGRFRTGTWDGLTFSNPWLGLEITFPEGSAVFSEEDMRKLVGDSGEILVNSGNYEDIQEKASEALNIYDFMVTMPDGRSSVQLVYLNTEKVASGREISAEDCLAQMAEDLSAIGDMGYELGEIEKEELAEKEFARLSASLMGGALYQEYYAVRAGDYVAVLTASYEEEGRAAVQSLIEGIRQMDR